MGGRGLSCNDGGRNLDDLGAGFNIINNESVFE
jgi:hypothetical protein